MDYLGGGGTVAWPFSTGCVAVIVVVGVWTFDPPQPAAARPSPQTMAHSSTQHVRFIETTFLPRQE